MSDGTDVKSERLSISLRQLREVAEATGVDISAAREGEPFLLKYGAKSVLIYVASEQELSENPQTLVCSTGKMPSAFRDDVYGRCSQCRTRIHWRPYIPETWTKICLQCAGSRAREAGDDELANVCADANGDPPTRRFRN